MLAAHAWIGSAKLGGRAWHGSAWAEAGDGRVRGLFRGGRNPIDLAEGGMRLCGSLWDPSINRLLFISNLGKFLPADHHHTEWGKLVWPRLTARLSHMSVHDKPCRGTRCWRTIADTRLHLLERVKDSRNWLLFVLFLRFGNFETSISISR